MDNVTRTLIHNEMLRRQEAFLPNNDTLTYVNQARERAKTNNLMNVIQHNNPAFLRKS